MSVLISEEIQMYNEILDEYAKPKDKRSVNIYRKLIGLMKMWKKINELGDDSEITNQIMINCLLLTIFIIRNGEQMNPDENSNDRKRIKRILSRTL